MIHYLPHHAVIRQDKKTTKVRVVYDASARTSGPSLNDCLHAGPKFNQRILEILLRFRSYPIALVADIEKAFLMISMSPKDRDMLRFLWLKDAFQEESEIVKLRFTRVASATHQSLLTQLSSTWWRKLMDASAPVLSLQKPERHPSDPDHTKAGIVICGSPSPADI